MKSKIASFIMTLMTILAIIILCFLGLIVYHEITKTNIASEVQDFVSNITISTEFTKEDIKTPEIVKIPLETTEEQTKENTNYNNNQAKKYFYNQLDKYAKLIYNEIEKNKENMKTGTYELILGTEISTLLSNDNGEELLGEYYQSAIEAYTYDNPDVFYIDYGKLYLNIETTTRGYKKTYKVFINSGNDENYLTEQFSSKEMIDSALNEIAKIKEYFVQNKRLDTYQNIKLVHDYLIESVEYEQTVAQPNIYDLYGALINKKSVCSGYAKAYKYLLDALDIPCVIVTGTGTNSEGNTENHAWNYVQLDENWYVVDCTWDDPILIGPGFLSNSSKYKYFLKGENDISKSHKPDGQFTENGQVFEFPVLSQVDY